MRLRKWHTIERSTGGYVYPLGEVTPNYWEDKGQRVYRCRVTRGSCQSQGIRGPECRGCDKEKHICYWEGFIGEEVPKIKAELIIT